MVFLRLLVEKLQRTFRNAMSRLAVKAGRTNFLIPFFAFIGHQSQPHEQYYNDSFESYQRNSTGKCLRSVIVHALRCLCHRSGPRAGKVRGHLETLMLMDFLHNVFQNEKTTDTTVISCLVSGTYDSRHHTKRENFHRLLRKYLV